VYRFLLILLISTYLESASPPFFVLTMPKGGTSMINEAIRHLSQKKTTTHPKRGLEIKKETYNLFNQDATGQLEKGDSYLFQHLIAGPFYQELCQEREDLVGIIHIRDLRDVLIANVYSKWDKMGNLLGNEASFDTRLLYAIQYPEFMENHNTYLNAKRAVPFLKDKTILVTRFEELVGEKGGGSDRLQRETLLKIVNHLHLTRSKEILKEIKETLFGSTVTFRKGQIGEWKTHFKQIHKDAFKEKYGDLLIEMGYEKDNNW
jgi:hypothetical protein